MPLKNFVRAFATGLVVLAGSTAALAQTPTPTYQGSLKSSGMAASGSFDFRLSLYSAPTGSTGLQAITLSAVDVSGGIFTVPLSFDPALYNPNQTQYIGIEVRPAGGSTYTALSPRQPIGAAAVALSVPGVDQVPTLTVDQDVAPAAGTTGAAPLSSASNAWQSVTSTATGNLRSVRGRIANTAASNRTLTATVFAGEGTSGAVLATGSTTLAANTDSGVLVEIPLQPAVAVTPGMKVSVRLRSTTSFVKWMISPSDVYAGGISSVSATQDFGIQTLVAVNGSVPAIRASGGLMAPTVQIDNFLGVGNNIGGTNGSAVASYFKQVVLSGDYNTAPNAGHAVKLLINDYDNETGSDIYPIYVEDENNTVDFFVRKQGGENNIGTTTAFLNGNLGLGYPAPNARLHISSPSVASTDFQILMNNDSVSAGSFKTAGMRVTNDGYFEVTNNAVNGATAVLARLSSLGTWSATSDARLKTDITPAEGMLDAAMKVRPVRFKWRSEGAKGAVQLGVIAQEFREAVPEFVDGDEQTGTLSVNYPGMGVVAIGAVQEQQLQINLLKSRLAASEAAAAASQKQTDELRARLEKLEAVTSSPASMPASTLRR